MHILDRLFSGPNPTKEQANAYWRGKEIAVVREYYIDVPVRTRRTKEMHEKTASEALDRCPKFRFDQMCYGDLWNDRVFPIYDAMTKEDIGL
jgi:hypothetical protein